MWEHRILLLLYLLLDKDPLLGKNTSMIDYIKKWVRIGINTFANEFGTKLKD